MNPFDAISLIAEAEPNQLVVLVGDCAMSALEHATARGSHQFDQRTWTAVRAAQTMVACEFTIQELEKVARDALDAARGRPDLVSGVNLASLAGKAAEMAVVAASGDTSSLAMMARDAYFLASRAVPERVLRTHCDESVKRLAILA